MSLGVGGLFRARTVLLVIGFGLVVKDPANTKLALATWGAISRDT